VRRVLLVLLVLLAWLQVRLWISDDGYRAAWRLGDQVSAQKDENETLRDRNRALAADVADLKTGVDAVEEIARSELGMIRSGETLFQVVDIEDDEIDPAAGGR
jgi:cell division protein FtsB